MQGSMKPRRSFNGLLCCPPRKSKEFDPRENKEVVPRKTTVVEVGDIWVQSSGETF